MCFIDFGAGGSDCGKDTTTTCFCEKFEAATGEAHFVVDYTVQQIHSEGMIRALWKNANNPALVRDATMALPHFYGNVCACYLQTRKIRLNRLGISGV